VRGAEELPKGRVKCYILVYENQTMKPVEIVLREDGINERET
jgi:hypothetical protein